ncbi:MULTISPECIES: M56 family metallopeptidase [unclassified Kribbella]|uniref:M56 family metallopeptidase n=1 Tax=unclassified Kribbella TaxID=2644121 RepID=UPI0033C51038
MSTFLAGVLVTYCVALGRGVDRWLSRSTWSRNHPRLALQLWQACGIATPSALVGAVFLLTHEVPASPEWMAAALLIAVLITGLSLDVVRRAVAAARIRGRHRLLVRLCARPTADRDVYLLDTPEVAAYCVPGRRRSGRVIVTSAGRRLLTDAEMAATVAHERAHLGQRHHAKILLADTITGLLAPFGLLPDYATQTRRLVEMAADDQAAGVCGRETVASALFRVGAAAGPASGPSPFLGVAASYTAERIRRLLQPARPTGRLLSVAVGALMLAITLVPPAVIAGSHNLVLH